MIVTFDFDLNLKFPQPCDVLDKNFVNDANTMVVQRFKEHMGHGDTIFVVTSRTFCDNSLKEIKEFLIEHSLKCQEILHTNGKLKVKTLQKLGSRLHYDDDPLECQEAERKKIKTVYTYNQEAETAFNVWMAAL